MRSSWRDLRYGARVLLKKPGFTLIAVLALALGIGANTAIFSVVMAVLARPLPYRESGRLVWLSQNNASLGVKETFLNPAEILDLREQAKSLEQVASWGTIAVNISNSGVGAPERVESIWATTNFLQTLGAQPMLGRDFTAGDGEKTGAAVIISHGLWRRRFGADPGVIGRKIKLGLPRDMMQAVGVIVGVMPPEFQFPPRVEVWMAYQHEGGWRGGSHNERTIARLKPGLTIAQAQAEISVIARNEAQQYPDTNAGWGITVTPFRDYLFGSANVALPLLLGAIGFVLLLACANIANMQLSRAAARAPEIAVRLAVGASRARIIRQLLTESLLLSVAGGAVGWLLALGGLELLRALGPDSIPRLKDAALDSQAIGFTGALSAFTCLLFGLAPAWKASGPDLQSALKNIGRTSAGAPGRRRIHSALIIGQVYLALTLLTGAGLLIKSFWKLQAVSPGFDSDHVLAASVALSFVDYPNGDTPRRAAYFRQALERVQRLPGVESVGAISHLMFGGRTLQFNFKIPGQEASASRQETLADYRVVTPSFFETLRIPLKRGRIFTERDTLQTPFVYLINEAFARTYFPGRDPLGVVMDGPLLAGEIIGVVGDVRHRGFDAGPTPTFYASYQQHATFPVMNFVIRASTDLEHLASDIRRALQPIDPNQMVFNVRPLQTFLTESTAQRRFNTLLLGLFATLALLLAVAGIYGVIVYAVALRIHEIGVRIALGARPTDALKLIMSQGMTPALIGVGIGLLASAGLTRLMVNLLFEVSASDPMTFVMIALSLTLIALLACYVPARRATKVDPMIALRSE
ncbi:MAG: ABC transporter permease [Chloracidobacterium sp.]|nr:ABC transporter permease [Chloracidobacterium sp.]